MKGCPFDNNVHVHLRADRASQSFRSPPRDGSSAWLKTRKGLDLPPNQIQTARSNHCALLVGASKGQERSKPTGVTTTSIDSSRSKLLLKRQIMSCRPAPQKAPSAPAGDHGVTMAGQAFCRTGWLIDRQPPSHIVASDLTPCTVGYASLFRWLWLQRYFPTAPVTGDLGSPRHRFRFVVVAPSQRLLQAAAFCRAFRRGLCRAAWPVELVMAACIKGPSLWCLIEVCVHHRLGRFNTGCRAGASGGFKLFHQLCLSLIDSRLPAGAGTQQAPYRVDERRCLMGPL